MNYKKFKANKFSISMNGGWYLNAPGYSEMVIGCYDDTKLTFSLHFVEGEIPSNHLFREPERLMIYFPKSDFNRIHNLLKENKWMYAWFETEHKYAGITTRDISKIKLEEEFKELFRVPEYIE
ncbi:MAG: hypothetical protein HKN00_04465 [Flavobacteriaceae bacterium]|nr:hypothetical protein [Bacteroidia bacterium]MBT8287932.1 hypothetical protein [Bacteroidia bacterium]NNF74415.1 hypothetical protein [Flavobacteriaceae bacterium]NNK73616.1 hypothetical protein [Flavobacteriaceae bacterium]